MNRWVKVAALIVGAMALAVGATGQGGQPAGSKMMQVQKGATAEPPVKPQQGTSVWQQIGSAIQGAVALKPVPQLYGMTQNQAQAALERAGLKGTFSNTGYTDWRVARQNPQTGSLKAGSNVDVTLGPMVPPLNGLTLDQATAVLSAAQLQLGAETREAGAAGVQTITQQNPTAGVYALPGSGVAVWLPPQETKTATGVSGAGTTVDTPSVSTGDVAPQDAVTSSDEKTMPRVLTLSYKQASSLLASLGVTSQPYEKLTRGTVQAQSVAEGSPIRRGERVTLTMGIVVPVVEGLTVADAEQQLQAAGLHGVYNGGAMHLPGTSLIVAQQTPEAFSVVTTDLTVILVANGNAGLGWLAGLFAVLGVSGWGIYKVIEKLVPKPVAEFQAKVNKLAEPIKVTIQPRVEFELRGIRGAGNVKTVRTAQVDSVKRGGSDV